jgi:hypothetical protein
VPANALLVIDSEVALQGEVRIVDVKGIAIPLVYQQRASYQIILNVSGVKPGLYALMIATRNGTVTKKVLIFR